MADRSRGVVVALGLALAALGLAPVAQAQMRTVNPDQVIDGDLSAPRPPASAQDVEPARVPANTSPADAPVSDEPVSGQSSADAPPGEDDQASIGTGVPEPQAEPRELPSAPGTLPPDPPYETRSEPPATTREADPAAAANEARASSAMRGGGDTYREDDLIGAAEGVFGKGAKGLADAIRDILRKQGEPNGYIVGREGSGAFVVGVRYGSGTLYHKVEGEQPVYWTGPSVGVDAGANAGNAFVLVYNLYDTADLYHRFAAGEGQAYLIGGFNVSYLRRGSVVLIPVRVGAGLRLGANLGYMKFSQRQDWVPF